MCDVYKLVQGQLPILVSMPHVGTMLPPGMSGRLTPEAAILPDTDWFVDQLYARVLETGVSVIRANYSRYIVDLNRPASNQSLYPGQATTGLVPDLTFHGQPIYRKGAKPSDAEKAIRCRKYWQPYHEAIAAELARMKAIHPRVLLWDAHSICSVLPAFFDGRLPDLNIGTNDGVSCAPDIQEAVERAADKSSFSRVSNGRYKGGHITRHFGRPEQGIHALQLEMAQDAYMDETPPFVFDEKRATAMSDVVFDLVDTAGKIL